MVVGSPGDGGTHATHTGKTRDEVSRFNPNMVLLWRADANSQAGPASLVFDSKHETDVVKFFFVYENVVMRGKSDEDKTGELLCYLQGEAFDYYYETYRQDGGLNETARDYGAVKKALHARFESVPEPEENIRLAVASRLDSNDLLASLNEMDRRFERASFNVEAKFGLLRSAVMEHVDVSQFVLYRSPTTYEGLKKAVKDFVTGRKAYLAARDAKQSQPQVPKRILQRPERRQEPDKIERKVDVLAEQLAELSLLMKKNQTIEQSEHVRTCSFCKEPGHGASRCRSNPHRDSRCPNCGKLGYGKETCWAKYRTGAPRAGAANLTSVPSNRDSVDAQVTYMDETNDGEVVAVTKRNADGEPLPKQLKTHEEVAIPRLLNPPVPFEMQRTISPPGSGLKRSHQRKKAKKVTKKTSLQEYVRKYNVISELANASSGLTFRQLVRGDADVAKREIVRLFAKQRVRGRTFAGHADTRSRRLRLVTVKVYGTEAQALLDSGAVPNIILPKLASKLCLSPQPTEKHITVADGANAPCLGSLHQIPTSFGEVIVKLDFLVVKGRPFDVIIGLLTLEGLQACIDLRKQHVQMTVGEYTTRLGLILDVEHVSRSTASTDSEDFTSDSEAVPASSTTSDNEFVLATLDRAPFEPDLGLTKLPDAAEDGLIGLPDLLEGEPDSESEAEEGESRADEENPERLQLALLREKLRHLAFETRESIVSSIQNSGIVAWSLDDLRSADVPVSHSFELEDPRPITHTVRRLPSRHNEVVHDVVHCGHVGWTVGRAMRVRTRKGIREATR